LRAHTLPPGILYDPNMIEEQNEQHKVLPERIQEYASAPAFGLCTPTEQKNGVCGRTRKLNFRNLDSEYGFWVLKCLIQKVKMYEYGKSERLAFCNSARAILVYYKR